jgi:hypothetical protein
MRQRYVIAECKDEDLICTTAGARSLAHPSDSNARLGIVFLRKHNNDRIYDRNDQEDPV